MEKMEGITLVKNNRQHTFVMVLLDIMGLVLVLLEVVRVSIGNLSPFIGGFC